MNVLRPRKTNSGTSHQRSFRLVCPNERGAITNGCCDWDIRAMKKFMGNSQSDQGALVNKKVAMALVRMGRLIAVIVLLAGSARAGPIVASEFIFDTAPFASC